MVTMALPVLFVFDLDETIIGETTPYIYKMDLHDFINNSVKAGKLPLDFKLPKLTSKDISPFSIRPGFKDFMTKLKEYFPTAECFVYSAGTKEYVQTYISYVEQITGCQFQRPLFSRVDCTLDERYNTVKSIKAHFPTMIDTLVSRYPALKDAATQDYVLNNRFVFLDDNDVVWDIKEKWIKAPHYKYRPVIDIAGALPHQTRQHSSVQNFLTVLSKMVYVFIEPTGHFSEDERNMMYYTWMANQYALFMSTNKFAIEDQFFPTLQKALIKVKNSNTPFSDTNMKHITEALQEIYTDKK